jgi:hypothetical protein
VKANLEFLIVALIAAVVMLASTASADLANTVCATNSADCTVLDVSSPTRITPKKLLVSLGDGDNVTFKCGTTAVLGPYYFGANSGLVDIFELPGGRQTDIRCAAGEDFVMTKGTSTTRSTVSLWY